MHWVDYLSNARHNSIEIDILRGGSLSTFVCTGSLYTGNESGKCLIALYLCSSPTWACSMCMYASGL